MRVRNLPLWQGGDVRFLGFDHERGAARVQLIGACSGCPSSASTLHGRVSKLLQHFVPEVETVEQVSDEEAAAMSAASGAGAAPPEEKVSIEEHMRRLMAEGEATSIVWDEAHRRPLM